MKRGKVLSEERGTALVITLLIIATLVGLTVAFSEESGVELNLAGYSRDGYAAYLAALGGCQRAEALLAQDEDRDVDSLHEPWALFEEAASSEELAGGASLAGKIVDENGKFNLNGLLNEAGKIDEKQQARLERLFSLLGLESNRVAPVLDWLDADDEKRLEGAETYYYQGLEHPYACGNAPFLTLGQIFLVKGMTPELASPVGSEEGEGRRLLDYLTIYGDGKINVNTAPRLVLQSLDEAIDSALADAVIAYRTREDFKRPDDLKKVSGISDEIFNRIRDAITVKSSCFSLEMAGSCQEAKTAIEAVLLMEEGKGKLVYWRVM